MKPVSNLHETTGKSLLKKTDIIVRYKGETIFVSPTTITLLEGLGNYTIIHTRAGQSFLVTKTLKLVSQNLKTNFIRVHRTYLVNSDFIVSRINEGRLLKMACGKEVSVSRRKIKETTVLLDSR